MHKKCEACGSLFHPNSPNSKYCLCHQKQEFTKHYRRIGAISKGPHPKAKPQPQTKAG